MAYTALFLHRSSGKWIETFVIPTFFFTFLDHFFFPVRVQMTLNKTIPFAPINVPFYASAYLLSSHIWTRLGCLVNSFRKVTPNNVALAFHIIRRCILDIWRCDGESDCADDSDEVACSTSKYFTPVKAFNLNSLGTLWDYSRKKLLPRAFFTRSHVTYSPSWQSRATAIRLKRITLRLLTNSSFSLPGPCAVCSLPLGQCLTKSLKTHRPRWIIRPSDGATFVSQTRHWLRTLSNIFCEFDLFQWPIRELHRTLSFEGVRMSSKTERLT